jgi:hypothetical protein
MLNEVLAAPVAAPALVAPALVAPALVAAPALDSYCISSNFEHILDSSSDV